MHKQITMPNGLKIIVTPLEGTKSVTVLCLVGAGSRYEKSEINGISHFLEHMAFKGSQGYSCDAIKQLIEGVGGLCVPLTEEVTVLDFIAHQAWPVVLVTAPRLGSINHTLLSLEALRARRHPLAAVMYNLHIAASPEIVSDTRRVIRTALARTGLDVPLLDLPSSAAGHPLECDFAGLPMPGVDESR